MPFLSILIISLFILVIKIGYKLNKLSSYINAMVGLSLVLQNLTIKCTNNHHLQCIGPFRAQSSRVADTFKKVSLFIFFAFIFLHCCRWYVSVPALMFTTPISIIFSGYTSKLYRDYFAKMSRLLHDKIKFLAFALILFIFYFFWKKGRFARFHYDVTVTYNDLILSVI